MRGIEYLDGSDLLNATGNVGSPIIIKGIVKAFPSVAVKYKVTPVYAGLVLGQIAVESDHFKTMEEYASGDAYDTRTDLGNTPERDGDGRLNKGAGLIQRTGHTNLSIAAKRLGVSLAEVRKLLKEDPEVALEDAFHYCMVERGKRTAQSAKEENIKILTKAVNGGTTHHAERVRYTRLFWLALLGHTLNERGIRQFQSSSSHYTDVADGKMGPKTERALWKEIKNCKWQSPAVPTTIAEKTTTGVVATGGSVGIGYLLYQAWQWLFGG